MRCPRCDKNDLNQKDDCDYCGYHHGPIITTTKICSSCNGSGQDNCMNCGGSGRLGTLSFSIGGGSGIGYNRELCPQCNGSGKGSACRNCKGSGYSDK